MATVTYDQTAEVIREEFPEFKVIDSESEDMAMSVYPPEDFHHSTPVDVWVEDDEIQMFIEDELVETLESPRDPAEIARVVTDLLQARDDEYVYAE